VSDLESVNACLDTPAKDASAKSSICVNIPASIEGVVGRAGVSVPTHTRASHVNTVSRFGFVNYSVCFIGDN